MALVLPVTVEELNMIHNSLDLTSVPSHMYVKEPCTDFDNIPVDKRLKREFSLPDGVEDFRISNYGLYLNFDDNIQGNPFQPITSNDHLVPVPEDCEFRQRSESFSSVSSSMGDKYPVYNNNMSVKTFNTVCMDSGSTCISSDHSYITRPTVPKELEPEETYQNLDTFLNQISDTHATESMSSVSSASSLVNDSNLEYSVLSNFSVSNCSQESFSENTVGLKRSSDVSIEDDIFLMSSSKRVCESPNGNRYMEVRKKNNIASKNCRKTRKEKQKEMETRAVELEKERADLKNQIKMLEDMIKITKTQLHQILKDRKHRNKVSY